MGAPGSARLAGRRRAARRRSHRESRGQTEDPLPGEFQDRVPDLPWPPRIRQASGPRPASRAVVRPRPRAGSGPHPSWRAVRRSTR
jgi:hypothetical protein